MTKLKNRLAEIQKRRAAGDKGFSLVELAVVIVVIGILVAIAVPVFNGIQDGANKAVAEAAAANGSSMVAAELAVGGDITATAFQASIQDLVEDPSTITVTGDSLTNYLVTVDIDGEATTTDDRYSKGPGTPTP